MSFDKALGITTVRLSQIAYRTPQRAKEDVAAFGLTNFQDFSGPSTQAFIADNGTHKYLAFRGTESTNHVDWMRDAQFKPIAGVFGTMVHSGFRRALDEVWDDLLPNLTSDNRGLIITGHSLGAGLAVLAAARLAASNNDVDHVYTYGSPRVGLKDFSIAYGAVLGSNTFRVINHIDIVTRVPLLLQGYRHVGRRVYFDGRGQFQADAGAWRIVRDDLIERFKHFGTIRSAGVVPHEILRYATRIESA